MKIERIEGIVVREIDYRNTSKIVTIITKEHGQINVLAKGAKQIKSNLRIATMPYIYCYFNIYYKPNGLSTMINADVINYLTNFKQDIKAYSYATYITEIMMQVIKNDFDESLYNLYINTILKINEGFEPRIITTIYELQIMDILGIKPNLDQCVSCGNPLVKTFSIEAGGCLCAKCSDNTAFVSEKILKLMHLLSFVDVSKISKLDIKDTNISELNMYIDLYFERYSGLYLKSKKALKTLTNL